MSKLNIQNIYTVTLYLEPKKSGMLILQSNLITNNQYNSLTKDSRIETAKDNATVNYGETQTKGIKFSIHSDYDSLKRCVEKMFEVGFDLVEHGIRTDTLPPSPRSDLAKPFDNLKVYLTKDIPTGVINTDWGIKDIIQLGEVDANSLIGATIALNKENIENNYE